MSDEKYECERQLVKEKRTHLMFLKKLASLGVNSSASRSRFHLLPQSFLYGLLGHALRLYGSELSGPGSFFA
jgi:hypothetical protein